MVRSRLYRDGAIEGENLDFAEITPHLSDPGVTVWIDVGDSQDDLAQVAAEFGLARITVESAATRNQRSRLVRYSDHLFITAYQVAVAPNSSHLSASPVAVFITPRALITVRPDAGFDIEAVVARWDETTDLAKHGVSYLLYGLLDHAIDSHFSAVEAIDERLDRVEGMLFADRPDPEVQIRSFAIRKNLVLFRRVVLPMREVMNALLRRDLQTLDDSMYPYYLDLDDHVLRVADWAESLRDFVSTILETNLAIQGNRLNSIMKKLTGWAAIIAIPAAITGFYGQNIPVPGVGEPLGLWISTAAIVVSSFGLYYYFRRKDWL